MLSKIIQEILDGWVAAQNEVFKGHPMAIKLRTELKNSLSEVLSDQDVDFLIKASAGAGAWANVPWVSMLNGELTTSTQEGIYPVYLFRADGSGVYLSLGFGTTKLKELYGAAGARKESVNVANKIQALVPQIESWGGAAIDLKATTDLGRSYEWATAGSKFYRSNELPTEREMIDDLEGLIDIYKQLPKNLMDSSQMTTDEACKDQEALAIPKPFLLLAGISGTGKTRFVRKQARESDPSGDNYCPVPVRPDWHEPSDLLGYISRLSGQDKYVTTDVLTFMVKAWRAAAPAADKSGMGEIDLQSIPYWLCLDEMNLAPVEQYFSDYLSVLESREFSGSSYSCEALLSSDTLKRLIDTDPALPANLGLDASDGLWQFFLHHGISLPPNLIVAGTVNMDETTHGFSRKVIDRAMTLDFGAFFPNDYAAFFEPTSLPVSFTWSPISQASKNSLSGTVDGDGSKSIEFLESVNSVFKRTPFELAYRALNELLLQVVCLEPTTDADLQALWDDFLMTKVLPRIDGDEDKLRSVSGDTDGTLLDQLENALEVSLAEIWGGQRKDYFRIDKDGGDNCVIECRSKEKLAWMKERLEINTFTSYWP